MLAYATTDAIIKVSNLNITQILVTICTIQLFIAVLWWLIKKPLTVQHWYGDKPNIIQVWLRGITYSLNGVFVWYAIIRLPLGDAYCIKINTPLLIAIGAMIFLKEKLPKTTPIIAILAIVGVMFIAQPTFLVSIFHPKDDDIEALNTDGIISMILAITNYAISALLIRKTKDNSHWLQHTIISSLLSIFIALPFFILINELFLDNDRIGGFNSGDWKFDTMSCIQLSLLGILGFVSMCMAVIGYQYGFATKVTWLEYSAIIFGFIYQIFLFNDFPNSFELIGTILVLIASSLSLLEEVYNHYFKQDYRRLNMQTADDESQDMVTPDL